MTGSLTLAQAMAVIARAQEFASASDKWATLAVVDAGGHLVACQRPDQSTVSHIQVAIAKAYSAAITGRSTHEAAGPPERAEIRAEMRQIDPRRTFLRGGFPLYVGSVLVGGVGVSGPSGDFDVACGQAALEALAAP